MAFSVREDISCALLFYNFKYLGLFLKSQQLLACISSNNIIKVFLNWHRMSQNVTEWPWLMMNCSGVPWHIRMILILNLFPVRNKMSLLLCFVLLWIIDVLIYMYFYDFLFYIISVIVCIKYWTKHTYQTSQSFLKTITIIFSSYIQIFYKFTHHQNVVITHFI